jgi:hypothetical protein
MQTFELTVFINCKRDKVYDHLSEPINMIGLQPRLTEIDMLGEKRDTDGIILRTFHVVETYRLLGFPIFRNRLYSVLRLVKPKEELEFRTYSKPGIEIVFHYKFQQHNDQRTQVTQTLQVLKANKLLENFVLNQAKYTQRVLLSNLKVRLEKH